MTGKRWWKPLEKAERAATFEPPERGVLKIQVKKDSPNKDSSAVPCDTKLHSRFDEF